MDFDYESAAVLASEFYYPDEKMYFKIIKICGDNRNVSEHVALLESIYSRWPWPLVVIKTSATLFPNTDRPNRKIASMYSFHIKQGDRGAKGPRGSPGRTGRAVSR